MPSPTSSRLRFLHYSVPAWLVAIMVVVLVTAGVLVTTMSGQARQAVGQEANFHCYSSKMAGPCPNLYGSVGFREDGYYQRTIRQQLDSGINLTDAFTLDVTCVPPHRPDETARPAVVNQDRCQPGTPARIVWAAKPGPIVWYGAYPDYPRQLSGAVGHYDFIVGELGEFELYGSDVSVTEPGQLVALSNVPGPAYNTEVSGPRVSKFGQALIDETGFTRTAGNVLSCDGANVYFSAWYEPNGSLRTRSFRAERDSEAMSTSAIQSGTTANPPAGRDLNWTFGPGVKPLGVSVVDWNRNSIQYSAPFPSGISFADQPHPMSVNVCGYDPSPAPAHYHS